MSLLLYLKKQALSCTFSKADTKKENFCITIRLDSAFRLRKRRRRLCKTACPGAAQHVLCGNCAAAAMRFHEKTSQKENF